MAVFVFGGEIVQFIDGAPGERNLMTIPKDGAISTIRKNFSNKHFNFKWSMLSELPTITCINTPYCVASFESRLQRQ